MQPSLPGILAKCWYGTRNKKVLEDYEGLAIFEKLLQSKTWNCKTSFQAKKMDTSSLFRGGKQDSGKDFSS